MSKPKMRTTGPPVEPTTHPPMVRSQAKQARKHHQEPQERSGSEAIHWEPYPQLTRDLLSWILQHPADRAVLFNETMDHNVQGKPHSQRKKDINAVIADAIFCQDRQYGESYTSHPAKFASAVASRLNKYHQHASRFKSTGEGVNPNNPNYRNLHEQVLAEFPFWEECDFLTIIKSRGTTAPPACDHTQDQDQDQDQDDAFEQEEEEEEGEIDEGREGEWNVVSVPGYQDDFMPVDQQPQMLGRQLPSQQETNPPSAMHRRTASSDSQSAFHMAPYPGPTASTISTTTTSSTPSRSTQRAGMISESSQTSLTKGKNVLAQIKADLNGQLTGLNEASEDQHLLWSTLKYEHKEIAHLETEHEKECIEAEKKKLDLEMLKEESELMHLKLELARLQSLHAGDVSIPSISTTVPPSISTTVPPAMQSTTPPAVQSTTPPAMQSTSHVTQSDGL
ncbi:hypothetical protein EDD15DRAFT_2361182 [Pisolithus albus]|nr:hypothetical protein EDD15DRAFT_2361182 [Pisolithus albus]